MPIDLERVLGATLGPSQGEWNEDDVILYHLALGAGGACTDLKELRYAYEAELQVLPTFGVISITKVVEQISAVPGLDFNPALALHGEHALELFGPLPTCARATTVGKIAAIYDKRKAAVLHLDIETRDSKDELLFINRMVIYLRGEGNFGGPHGPSTVNRQPQREPDLKLESPTLPQQALLYRLTGDHNPLHADPRVAAMAGFDRPILHGLCSFGIVGKAVVDHCLDGNVAAVASYQTRFKGVLFPGETIVTSIWREGGEIFLAAESKERGTPVLSNAVIKVRS